MTETVRFCLLAILRQHGGRRERDDTVGRDALTRLPNRLKDDGSSHVLLR